MFDLRFYDEDVERALADLPPGLGARMLRLFELLKIYGNEIGSQHSKAFGDGLYELRARAGEGIARAFYAFDEGRIVIILHIFIKKDQKTPKRDLARARKILKELRCEK